MPTVFIKNRDIMAVATNATVLGLWCKPDTLAWRAGQIKNAVMPHAELISKLAEAMLDESVEHEDGVDGAPGKRKIVDVLDPETGRATGRQTYVWVDMAEFLRRDRALQDEGVEVVIPKLLTEEMIEQLERQRVAGHPLGQDGQPIPTVDFGALAPVIDGTAVVVG